MINWVLSKSHEHSVFFFFRNRVYTPFNIYYFLSGTLARRGLCFGTERVSYFHTDVRSVATILFFFSLK